MDSSILARFEEERVSPVWGYEERDVQWFEENILPDLHEVHERLKLGPTLMDVGCGFGYFTVRYTEYFEKVYGVDFSEKRIAGAKQHNPHKQVEYRCRDLLKGVKIPVDTVITSAVIQHINPDDRIKAMINISSALPTGGYMIMYDENFNDRPHMWDGFYQPISPDWLESIPLWRLEDYKYVAKGLHGEKIYRYEMQAVKWSY